MLSEESALTKITWKKVNEYLKENEIEEVEIEDFKIRNTDLTNFEKKMNNNYLFFKKFESLTWDPFNSADNIDYFDKNKIFKSKNSGWCIVHTEKKLSRSVHLVELLTNKMDDNHFAFIGVNDKKVKDSYHICVYHNDGNSCTAGLNFFFFILYLFYHLK